MQPTATLFSQIIQAITAIGGLGLAAMALVDALKAIPGGAVSAIGFSHVAAVADRFSGVFSQAIGGNWLSILRAHWINGRPAGEQKAIIRSLLRLGLTVETAPQLAAAANVDPKALSEAAGRLVDGEALSDQDVTLLGRVEAVSGALFDGAFDLADQAYRNRARALAAVFAVILAVAGGCVIDDKPALKQSGEDLALYILIGLMAVPIAPITKDLVSALTASVSAVKAARGAR